MEKTVENARFGDDRDLIVVGAESIYALLTGKEHEIVEIVSGVYRAHARRNYFTAIQKIFRRKLRILQTAAG
jgi:hypothetical protein